MFSPHIYLFTPPAPGFLFLIHTLRTPRTADAALTSPSISHMAIGISTLPIFVTHNELQGPKYKNTQKTYPHPISWVFPYFAARCKYKAS